MSVGTELKQLVVEVLGVDDDKVTSDARFIDDLGADSLQLVELVMAIEERFGIEIPDEDAEQIDSIRDAFNYIVAAAAGTQPPAPEGEPAAPEGEPAAPEGEPAAPEGEPVAPEGEAADESPPAVDPGALDPPVFEEPAAIPAQPPAGEDEDDETLYAVVVNAEEEYAIWPIDRETPAGWRETGMRGTKSECLAHIEDMGDDVRPQPLRPELPGD